MSNHTNLINFIHTGPQFTLLGDTFHGDQKMQAFFRSADFFRSLKEAGVKNLFLERPRQFQSDIDADTKLFQGVQSEADVHERTKTYIESAKKSNPLLFAGKPGLAEDLQNLTLRNGYAKLYGVSIHYADHDSQKDPTRTGAAEGGVRDDAYRCYTGNYADLTNNYHAPEKGKLQKFKRIAELRERLRHDDSVAKLITEKAGREKSVALYGSAHLDTEYGLASILGDKAQVLNIFSSADRIDNNKDNTEQFAREHGENHSRLSRIPSYVLADQTLTQPSFMDKAKDRVFYNFNGENEWEGPRCLPQPPKP